MEKAGIEVKSSIDDGASIEVEASSEDGVSAGDEVGSNVEAEADMESSSVNEALVDKEASETHVDERISVLGKEVWTVLVASDRDDTDSVREEAASEKEDGALKPLLMSNEDMVKEGEEVSPDSI